MFILIRLISDILLMAQSYVSAYLIRFDLFSFEGLFTFPYLQYANYLISALMVYIATFFFVGRSRLAKA
jgi:hypothetical protein